MTDAKTGKETQIKSQWLFGPRHLPFGGLAEIMLLNRHFCVVVASATGMLLSIGITIGAARNSLVMSIGLASLSHVPCYSNNNNKVSLILSFGQ